LFDTNDLPLGCGSTPGSNDRAKCAPEYDDSFKLFAEQVFQEFAEFKSHRQSHWFDPHKQLWLGDRAYI
jgi:hypothetical protein